MKTNIKTTGKPVRYDCYTCKNIVNKYFGDRFQYLGIEVYKGETRIKLKCPEHGVFSILPNSLYKRKYGCSGCAIKYREEPPFNLSFGRRINKIVNIKELFKEKLIRLHPEYDYSETNYTDNYSKVCIICRDHGAFYKTPNDLLQLNFRKVPYCPKCMRAISAEKLRKSSELRLISKLNDKFNGRVKFVDTYIDWFRDYKFKCVEHGEFVSRIPAVLSRNGSGCSICDKNEHKRRMLNKFIEEAKRLWGDKYDYSRINLDNYVNSDSKVPIVCPEHGLFYQQIFTHATKSACPKCSRRKGLSNFLNEARIIHGNRYIYDKVEFNLYTDKVWIKCKKHGYFKQKVRQHLLGSGCSACYREEVTKSREKFILDARSVHGNKYDYSRVVYNSNKSKIIIGCPKHGWYKKLALTHLQGGGCPRCRDSFGEIILSRMFDNLNIKYIREYRLNGGRFRYDFFLPDLNLLVEFHGLQHYEPVSKFGGTESYKRTLIRDKLKVKLANKLMVPLIIINYKQLHLDKSGNRLFRYLIKHLLKYYPFSFKLGDSFKYVKTIRDIYHLFPETYKIEYSKIMEYLENNITDLIPLHKLEFKSRQ